MTTDVLYLTWNRRAYTEFSLAMLLANTDWPLVRRLVIHDDGSDKKEGTVNLVRRMTEDVPVEVVIYARKFDDRLGSPPGVMNWYIERFGDSDRFAKIDSDIVVPSGWLGNLAGVMDRDPSIELLGMEAGRMGPPGHNGAEWSGVYGFEPGSHIGGVGLMATGTFRKHLALGQNGRFGFTEWQHEYDPVRGWIAPDLLVSELTRIPFPPWVDLSAAYQARDWEREWPKYHERWDYWWGWWPE